MRELRDVDGVSIQADEDRVTEIHVETSSSRPAKHIVRDVQTILRTRFNRQIDHRVVSVAYTESPREQRPVARPAAAPPAPAPIPVPPPAASAAARPAVAEVPEVMQRRGSPAPVSTAEARVRFESVNLYVVGPRATAEVELRWKGLKRSGAASGLTSREAADQLIAAAALAAMQEFLEDDVGLGRPEVEHLRIGRHEVKIVAVPLVAHRMEKMLVGSCTVEQDAQQAVVLATLDALNRVMGGLRTREPIEYVLRPASPQEASGANRE